MLLRQNTEYGVGSRTDGVLLTTGLSFHQGVHICSLWVTVAHKCALGLGTEDGGMWESLMSSLLVEIQRWPFSLLSCSWHTSERSLQGCSFFTCKFIIIIIIFAMWSKYWMPYLFIHNWGYFIRPLILPLGYSHSVFLDSCLFFTLQWLYF